MMRWHRLGALIAGVLIAWVVLTGTLTEMADLRPLVTGASPMDPDLRLQRQHIYGPPNYAVLSPPDFVAPALPARFDYVGALTKAATLGRSAAPGAPLRFVEVRTVGGKSAAQVQMGGSRMLFDLAGGSRLPDTLLPPLDPARGDPALRATLKSLHRFGFLGAPLMNTLNLVIGLALATMIVTGLLHYWRLYRLRARMKRDAPFWKGGGWLREVHRWVALAACLPLIWLTVSGIVLSSDDVGGIIHSMITPPPTGPSAFDGDFSRPLRDAELPAMARTALAAYRSAEPGVGIRTFRLRSFAGYSQGVVITDHGPEQKVYNAAAGQPMRMWERGYPDLGFPSGWEYHQLLKRVHRGDVFGLTGRWLDLAGGLSLGYLAISGLWMYGAMWLRRRKAGRRGALIWK